MRSLFWSGVAIVAVLTTMSSNLWRELRTERAVSAELRAKLAATEGRMRVAQASALRAEVNAPAPATMSEKLEPKSAAPARSSGDAAMIGNVLISESIRIGEKGLLEDPEYRKARLALLRLTVRQNYPGLADALGLSSWEADQFFELMAQNQLNVVAQLTLALTGDEQADQATREELIGSRQAMQRELNDSLSALLGDVRYKQWQYYQQTHSTRMQVHKYSNAMTAAGVSLDSNQSTVLVTAAINEERSLKMDAVKLGSTVDPGNPETRIRAQQALKDRQAQRNQRILATAATSLSAQQLNVLREQFEQEAAVKQAQDLARERTETLRFQRYYEQ
jgi:hypothetical protein